MRHTTESLPRAWRTKKRVWLYCWWGWQFFIPQYLKSPAFPVAQVSCSWVQRIRLPALVCREPQWPGQVMPLLLMNHDSLEGAKQVLACCILVRARCYTSQSWRKLGFCGKKGRENGSGFRCAAYMDVSYLCKCQAVLLDWTPITPPSGQNGGLLVAHLHMCITWRGEEEQF